MEDAGHAAAARVIEWATRTLTQGEVLAAFADHCSSELDDVDVVEHEAAHLDARWRSETSRIELCDDLDARLGLATGKPTMLLADFEVVDLDALAGRFADDRSLRSSLALCDLVRLEKINAVRSSVFVYFEWFLRDAYGVKLLSSAAFTQGLVSRGIISLGFG